MSVGRPNMRSMAFVMQIMLRTWFSPVIFVISLLGLTLTSCAPKAPTTQLRAADFDGATPEQPAADALASAPESIPAPAPAPVSTIESSGGVRDATRSAPDANGPTDVLTIAGPPSISLGAGDATPTTSETNPSDRRPTELREQRLQVDQMVGQVNGRPVFAAAFLEPMDARFAREAERLPVDQWLALAKDDIQRTLMDRLRDELLLAEFEATLTPEQKMGVLAFIEEVRADLISGNLGSREQANQRLLESEGLDLDAKVEDVTEQQFILAQLRKAIGDRIHVSFVDVRRYYDQHIDEFLPPPTARFRIIRVPSSRAEAIKDVETALTEDHDFAQLAALYSTWSPEDQNMHEVVIENRSFSAMTLFGPEDLNSAAQALEPQQRTPGIVVGSSRYWIKLEELHQPEGMTLYDAQDRIESVLRNQRLDEEEKRYLNQLFLRGNFSDIDKMIDDLVEFAHERYLVQRPAFRAAGAAAASP